jgi:hypothetical protein
MPADVPRPKLTEADVLFELFLPLVCESKAALLEQFEGTIELHLDGDPPRSWHVRGGPRPWLQRGAAPRPPVLKVTVAEGLVKQIVQGKDPDLSAARSAGALTVEGELSLLESLGLSRAEFDRVIGEALGA